MGVGGSRTQTRSPDADAVFILASCKGWELVVVVGVRPTRRDALSEKPRGAPLAFALHGTLWPPGGFEEALFS